MKKDEKKMYVTQDKLDRILEELRSLRQLVSVGAPCDRIGMFRWEIVKATIWAIVGIIVAWCWNRVM